MKLLPWFRHTVDTSFDVCCKIAAVAKSAPSKNEYKRLSGETATQPERGDLSGGCRSPIRRMRNFSIDLIFLALKVPDNIHRRTRIHRNGRRLGFCWRLWHGPRLSFT